MSNGSWSSLRWGEEKQGAASMQLHPIPEHFQGADGIRKSGDGPQDSARSWAVLSLLFPEPGWAPGTRQVPNKVVRAQERSCHTSWPWGAPCSLCCQQGSESGTNPAKTPKINLLNSLSTSHSGPREHSKPQRHLPTSPASASKPLPNSGAAERRSCHTTVP